MKIPSNLPPELILLAFAMVLVGRIADKLIDVISQYANRKLNGKNGRSQADLAQLCRQIEMIIQWLQSEGMHLAESAREVSRALALLPAIRGRLEDNYQALQHLKDRIR